MTAILIVQKRGKLERTICVQVLPSGKLTDSSCLEHTQSCAHTHICTHTYAHTQAHTQAPWGCRQSGLFQLLTLLSLCWRTHAGAAAPAPASASTCGTNPQLLGRKATTNLDSMLKSRDLTLPAKIWLDNQSYGFSSSHVWMWELGCEESWVQKNGCF